MTKSSLRNLAVLTGKDERKSTVPVTVHSVRPQYNRSEQSRLGSERQRHRQCQLRHWQTECLGMSGRLRDFSAVPGTITALSSLIRLSITHRYVPRSSLHFSGNSVAGSSQA
jgi:hypothetical protein